MYGTPNATKIQNVVDFLSDCRSGEIDCRSNIIDCRSGEIDYRSNVDFLSDCRSGEIDCRVFERLSFW